MLSIHQAPHHFYPHLNREIHLALSKRNQARKYKKKQVLYYEGNPVVGLYCIKSGKAKVYKTGPEGKQYTLRLARENDLLGLESLFQKEPYFSTSAEMVEDGEVSLVERNVLVDMISRDNKMAYKMMMLLAAQIICDEEQMVDLAHRAVRERLARLLLDLSESYGTRLSHGTRLNLDLTREDIAEMIGTCSKSAIRLLSDLKDEKVIEIRGKDIIILSNERLLEIANIE